LTPRRLFAALALLCMAAVGAPEPATAQQLDLSHGGPIDITARDGIEWRQVEQQDWTGAEATCLRINKLFEFLASNDGFGSRGFTDTAFDRLGGTAGGFLKCGLRGRGPYPSATPDDVAILPLPERASVAPLSMVVVPV